MNLQKKFNALLKIRGILCIFFFHFLLDIISRSRYHFISYYIISTHIPWDFFQLFYKLRDNKTDVDLKWIQWFFLFSFFFYTVYKLDQAKLIKDPEWIYMYFKKTLPQKNTQYWKEKNPWKFKGMQKNFLNPLLSLEDPTILKFASITLSHIFYPQSQNI